MDSDNIACMGTEVVLKSINLESDQLKVLFVTTGFPPNDIGGAEIQAYKQACSLNELGCKVSVVTQSRNFRFSKEFVTNIMVTRLPWRNGIFIGKLFNLATLVLFMFRNGRKFDVIHIHLANLQADVCVFICRILKLPTLIKVASGGKFGEIARFTSVAKLTKYYGLRRANAIQSISDEILTELLSIGVKENRIHKIPNGVNIEISSSDERENDFFREKYSIELRTQIFLYIGRMAAYKGIDVLLKAWKMRCKKYDSILILVGPVALDKPFTPNSLPKDVIWVGESKDPTIFFKNADVFVLPSFGEGMSNSLLEAISFQVPCIVTNVGSNKELIKDKKGGLVIEPGNTLALTESINWMLRNPMKRVKMSEYAFANLRNYEIGKVAQSILDLYLRIIGAE